jgi:hypothetical protein
MLLAIRMIDGWHHVIIAGTPDKFGYSTEAAAKRRMEDLLSRLV